ncbi:prephenate dehydratase [Ammoniphilus sp. CFH 90114]|uniref:prephenate dehydratase n=1 Tax=Ammoniphilus sp. CFH 90114 TaxID=2493665 RepID=UPI00100E8931|nr:prephenate dehydratase [Ammoniphilus sp. CFH 90114]RXT14738.1 prephenate dehydratase [Ammoniphilus sp. CFH 90114]
MERKIAFLGPYGTFTEEAARFFFEGQDVSFVPFATIPDVLDALDQGKTQFAVVPIENSIEGTVNLTMDWLIHHMDVPIRGELAYPISQHLMAAPGTELKNVKKVFSHPQAVAQSRLFLRKHLPDVEVEYMKSTADAVKWVAEHPSEPWAAIGNRLSKEIYPVVFLHESIQDHDNNYTRFLVVSSSAVQFKESEKEKTTILVTLPSDFPGALYQVLAAFAWRKINLSRIESRPTKTGLGNYHFIIDIEQKMDEILLPGAFAELEALGCQIRKMGSYPCFMKQIKVNS